MRVVHVPFCFYPDPAGGTEVYVAALAAAQCARGAQAIVAAPGEVEASYQHDGLPVRRFRVSPAPVELAELYGPGDALAATSFGRLLDAERPDLVHLHAFTRGVSLRVLREAHRRGLPVVFTYHTPAVSCQRGTLLRWGKQICDGTLRLTTCAACTLHGHGLARPASDLIALTPRALGAALGRAGRSGGPWTALRMRHLLAGRHAAIRALLAEADALVVLAEWTRALLLRNGVPAARITLSRHGLGHVPEPHRARRPAAAPLRVAFLGRLDPAKGVDLLIAAVRQLPEVNLRLDIFGVVQSGGADYAAALRQQAAGDPRIQFLPPAPSAQVVELLTRYDLLAAPSRVLETGPLVALEAFAAGTPVLGSALGGIAELVTDGVDGLLVASGTPAAWAEQLALLAAEPARLQQLRAGVRSPRRIEQVADEMLALYGALAARRARPALRG